MVNTHPMITRAKNGIYKPKALLTNFSDAEPKTIQEALAHPYWSKVVHEECTAPIKNKTWTLTYLPPNRRAIGL